MEEKKYDLIKFSDGNFSLDVNVSPSEETVWLNREQISLLFERDIKTIGKHISNIIRENELEKSVIAFFATTAKDGKTYNMEYYNLDMIISVGYRVKSKRGILFRRWANQVLKQYLLNGYAINENRIMAYQSNILKLESTVNGIEKRLNIVEEKINLPDEKIIYEGEILEAYTFIRKLFFLAKNNLTIVDYYADNFLLSMLKDIKVNIEVITSSTSYLNGIKFPDSIKVTINDSLHDRFIIVDDTVYAIGTSFNSIGKGEFVIIKFKDLTKDKIIKKRDS